MRFVTLFTFDIMDAIREGHKAYMLDRRECKVVDMRELEVGQFLRLIDVAEKDRTNRYTFWKEESE